MKEPIITLAHGGGGKLTEELVRKHFLPPFRNQELVELLDSAVISAPGLLAFTTDAFVVRPIFFPGGDIGKLAVCGAVNDLAAVAAQPLFLSASFIIEEGLPLAVLDRLLDSMATTSREVSLKLVCGDTKVVEKGAGDQLYISTSAIGIVKQNPPPAPRLIQEGDDIVLSGRVGEHELAVLQARENFFQELDVLSDCAPLWPLVEILLREGVEIHAMRDPTRGGLATVAAELARSSNLALILEEDKIPIGATVQSACNMLGLDPLYLANEGKMLFIVPGRAGERVQAILRSHPLSRDTRVIGEVRKCPEGAALLRGKTGGTRLLESIAGELLPRIC